MLKFIIATRNDHKVGEIESILGGIARCLSLKPFPLAPSVIENAPDFRGNAMKKSVELARWFSAQQPAAISADSLENTMILADDSGLEVDCLNGAPGVHSARFAALDKNVSGNSPDLENNTKLLRLLHNVPLERRTARFRCALAISPIVSAPPQIASPVCLQEQIEFETQVFEGACEGHIALEPSGKGGFGYDPLFVPSGFTQSFAELGESSKNRISHRAKALENLMKAFKSLNS